MDDYERILRSAIARLGDAGQDARYAVYERARQTMLKQLRAMNPPLPDADIDARIKALYDAAMRIEAGIAGEASAPPPPRAVRPDALPAGAPAAARGGISALAVIGVLAAILVAGLGAYYFVAHDRAAPVAQTGSKAPAKVVPAKSAAPNATAPKPAPAAQHAAEPGAAPFYLRQQRVFYRTTQPVGTVIVSRNQHFLYVVMPNQTAIRYAIGLGPACDNVAGLFRVIDKVNATPADPKKEPFTIPALYFDASRAVHRSTEPDRIGDTTKTGCIQAWDQDIADLYDRVALDQRVVVGN